MMKTIIWLVAVTTLLGSGQCKAQGIFGFFSQQAKKKKLMMAQVAALTIYSDQQATGYAISRDGLRNAQTQKGGEYSDHEQYYASLEQVSPAISPAEKKKKLLDLQARINAAFNDELGWQQKYRALRKDEMDYLVRVACGIRRQCDADMTEMNELLTPGKLKLTDAERLDRLDRLLAVMKDKSAFTLSITGKCRQLAQVRMGQVKDQEQLKKLYGN
jgi:hypothetical protein